MELRFLLSAVRRWYRALIALAILVPLAAVVLGSRGSDTYQSSTVLLVQPLTDRYIDPDRYVVSQLGVLRSFTLAQAVAKKVGERNPDTLLDRVDIVQQPRTDLVTITANERTVAGAVELANAWALAYIEHQQEQLGRVKDPQLKAIDSRLVELRAKLQGDEAALALDPTDATARADRDTLLSEYSELVRARTSAEVSNGQVNSQVVDTADGADPSGDMSPLHLAILGLLGALVLGVGGAVVYSWLTPMLVDPFQYEEATGSPIAATMQVYRNFPATLDQLLAGGPSRFTAVMQELGVQVEARSRAGDRLSIAVVSSRREAGTSAVATGIAQYYADATSKVLLVDADEHGGDVTRDFSAHGGAGALATLSVRSGDSSGAPAPVRDITPFTTRTGVNNLLAIGGFTGQISRSMAPAAVRLFSSAADVTVFDCAPILESATAVHLCQLVDVVIFLAPTRRSRRSVLVAAANQLSGRPFLTLATELPPAANASSGARLARQSTTPVQGVLTASGSTGEG